MTVVLVASDKFKGSLTASEVGRAVGAGINRRRSDVEVDVFPVADGGDGTLAAAVAAGFTFVPVTAPGPTGEPVESGYARDGARAVVELADVSGLVRLPGGARSPMQASTVGVGEVIAAALQAGCRDVMVGIGGSASTDGGAGLVTALGARLLAVDGQVVAPDGAHLPAVARLDLSGLADGTQGATFTVACDVDNPLTGPCGAAAVYAPQKGATPAQVDELERALTHWADLVAATTGTDVRDQPGAGAAGGVGFAALALLGAVLRPGIELVLDLVDFENKLVGVDLVITGEGALDEQTLHGKAPAGVAAAARAAGVPVVAVCGHSTLDADQLEEAGISTTYALTDLESDIATCIRDAAQLLERLGERIAADHLTEPEGC